MYMTTNTILILILSFMLLSYVYNDYIKAYDYQYNKW